MKILKIDHVQLAIPEGGEPLARKFYSDIMGLTEVPKPAEMAGRGGCWFEGGDVQLHLGVEANFRPAKKAHSAFEVTELTKFITYLGATGVPVKSDVALPGIARIQIEDPFGNRIELLERQR